MSRLIDADALCRLAQNSKDRTVDCNDIMRMPIVDTVKHGKWVDRYGDGDWHCSECGAIVEKDEQKRHYWQRCYHCGAMMDLIQPNDSNVLNALDENEKYNWIILGNGEYKCPKCGDTSVIAFKKCNTCGVRMDNSCADCQEFDCYGCEYKKGERG